jgi:LysR family transcriptional regulator, regulator for metE and metH
MPALDAFRAQWPDVALDLSAAFSFALLPALVCGDLDLVITSDPEALEAVTYLPLFKLELVLAVSASNSLAASKYIVPEQL